MSPGLIKMFLALSSIILMFLANILIITARDKLKGVWKAIVSIFAYTLLIVCLILVVFVVFSY